MEQLRQPQKVIVGIELVTGNEGVDMLKPAGVAEEQSLKLPQSPLNFC
jgi:hypothetical protein